MKKISSKIIIIFFLTVILWSGVGTFGVHAANAWSIKGVALGIIAFPLQLIIIPVLGILVRIAGLMLDLSVQFTLNSAIFGGGVAIAISTTWAIIRNIFNITFIFILLYTAIRTIIGSSSANTKKMIANVIIAALLINFSLFITRILVDVGNILAMALYNKIVTDPSATFGIGSILMQKIGMSEIFQYSQLGASTGGFASVPFFIASCLQLITLLTLLITFIYAALLMLSRTVVLIFVMVLSPIGFMGDVLPSVAEYSKMWKENLMGQTMIAPVFLLFIYLITLIGQGLAINAQTTAAPGADPTAAEYMVYFKFLLIIVLIIAAVKITKKMTGVVGSTMEKFGGLAVTAALGAATGGAALLARQTIGRSAAKKLDSPEGEALRAKAAAGDTGARIKLARLEKSSTSSFDIRNAPGMGLASKAFGTAGGQLGLKIPGAGKPGAWASVGGFGFDKNAVEARKAQQEAENKRFDALAPTDKQKLAANDALRRRDENVKTQLDGPASFTDPVTGLASKTYIDPVTGSLHYSETQGTADVIAYNKARNKKTDLLHVKDTHVDLVNEQAAYADAKNAKAPLDAIDEQIRNGTLTLGAAALDKHKKEYAEAKRIYNEAARVKEAKIKTIQAETKEKRKGELAELDNQMKAARVSSEKAEEAVMPAADQAVMAIVNQARDYADSVRHGRKGTRLSVSTQARRTQVAERMENRR